MIDFYNFCILLYYLAFIEDDIVSFTIKIFHTQVLCLCALDTNLLYTKNVRRNEN